MLCNNISYKICASSLFYATHCIPHLAGYAEEAQCKYTLLPTMPTLPTRYLQISAENVDLSDLTLGSVCLPGRNGKSL